MATHANSASMTATDERITEIGQFIGKLGHIVTLLRQLQARWDVTPEIEEMAESPNLYNCIQELDEWYQTLSERFTKED